MDSSVCLNSSTSEKNIQTKYFGFTKRQILFLFTYGLYNIFRGALVLLIGPLYPPEAEDRDVSNTTVGFVMGSYDFATFLVSIFYGKVFIPKFGPHRVIVFSAFNTAISAALFGCLGFIRDKTTFVVLSVVIRVIGGAGDAGFYPSCFTIFAHEFVQLVSTTVGLFELFFGIGAILGPILCVPLVDVIGFSWTYILVAACLLLSAFSIVFITPQPANKAVAEETIPGNEGYGMIQLLKIPAIYYGIFCLFTTAASIGFITGTLENHLRQFQLTSAQVGAIFTISSIIYTICSPIWGQVSDRFGLNKVIILASGSFLLTLSFILLGPLDFISKKYTLWLTLLGLALHGIGIGSAIMVFFPYASESAIDKGFPDTTATYGLVSSIFTLTFSLGNAFGPAVSGTLYDAVGFKDATLVVIGLASLGMLSAGLLIIFTRKARSLLPQQT